MNESDLQNLQTITLQKTKLGMLQTFSEQMAQDMDTDVLTDWLSDNLVARMRTFVLSHKDGEDTQRAYGTVEVLPRKWLVLGVACLPILAGIGLLLFDLYLLAALAFQLTAFITFLYILRRPVRARKEFRIKATRWNRFPQNTLTFPSVLGPAIVQIETEVEDPAAPAEEETE